MRKVPVVALAAFAALALSGAAAMAQVKVIGTGLASSCSRLALAGLSDRNTLETCNLALTEEALGTENAAKTHVNRGVIHLRRSSLDLATNDFARAERLMPNLPEVYINRGVVLMKQRRWAEAITAIEKGLALNPNEAEKAYFNRALAREQIDDFRGAYEDFRTAAQLNPKWEAPQRELARYQVRRPT